jgi:hypothetical protein
LSVHFAFYGNVGGVRAAVGGRLCLNSRRNVFFALAVGYCNMDNLAQNCVSMVLFEVFGAQEIVL